MEQENLGLSDIELNGHLFAACQNRKRKNTTIEGAVHGWSLFEDLLYENIYYTCLKCRMTMNGTFNMISSGYRAAPDSFPLNPCTGWKSYKLKNLLK